MNGSGGSSKRGLTEDSYRPGWDCHGLPIELNALKEKQALERKAKKKKRANGGETVLSPASPPPELEEQFPGQASALSLRAYAVALASFSHPATLSLM
jgi:hypothetical protein